MKKELLELLVCPENHSSLRLADDLMLGEINAAIAKRKLKNRAGHLLDAPLDAALVRADDSVCYPIIDDIPRMLVDEAISLAQLDRIAP